MKKKNLIYILTTFVVALCMFSCDNQDSENLPTGLEVNFTQASIAFYEPAEDASAGTPVHFALVFSSESYTLILNTYSSDINDISGTYKPAATSVAPNTFDSRNSYLFTSAGESSPIDKGDVSIEKNGNGYTIALDFTGSDQIAVKGNFSGSLETLYVSNDTYAEYAGDYYYPNTGNYGLNLESDYADGTGFYAFVELINVPATDLSKLQIPAGNYTIRASSDPFSIVPGKYDSDNWMFWGSYGFIYLTDDMNNTPCITKGSVKILQTGDTYVVITDFSGTDANSGSAVDGIKFFYQGTIDITDKSKAPTAVTNAQFTFAQFEAIGELTEHSGIYGFYATLVEEDALYEKNGATVNLAMNSNTADAIAPGTYTLSGTDAAFTLNAGATDGYVFKNNVTAYHPTFKSGTVVVSKNGDIYTIKVDFVTKEDLEFSGTYIGEFKLVTSKVSAIVKSSKGKVQKGKG
ncbi:MAG: hypothetical protein LBO74_03000 [Candidatus Symbiothrix sp.]|jgi:hypothetical protein|nr:hypothetical protein [Candidatus Symbiothrix sp.]